MPIDGSRLYVVGNQNDTTYAYDLSTPYDLSTASYASESFSVTFQESVPQDIAFSTAGDKMYIIGNNDAVYEYDLSTSWDVSTASYNSHNFSVASQALNPTFIAFSDDGTKMYTGVAGNFYQYTLSTAWDITTASYASKTFNFSATEGGIQGIWFKPDGTKCFLVGLDHATIYVLDLSTAWDISTAAYNSDNLSISSQESSPRCLALNDDGTKAYVLGSVNDTIYAYDLSTPYDISTGTYNSESFSVTTQENTPLGMAFGIGGTTYTQNLSETVTLVDSITRIPGKSLTDSTTLVDSFARSISKNLSDVVVLVDNLVSTKILNQLINESLTLSDAISRSVGKVLASSLTLVDSISSVVAKGFSESILLADTLTRTTGKVLTETVTIIDRIRVTLNGLVQGLWDKVTRITSSWSGSTRKTSNWNKIDRE